MYTFVFLWTPTLSPNKQAIPHGFIFATFMFASMLGSSLASHLLARIDLKVESYMQLVFLVAASSLCLPVLITVSSSKFPASSGVYVAWSKLLQIPSFSDLSVDILLAGLLHSYTQVFGILLSSLFAGFCGNNGQASMNHRGHQMVALVRDECESSHCIYDARWTK
jgi:predicted neutral ceramidase superfamily lipid hydrolase